MLIDEFQEVNGQKESHEEGFHEAETQNNEEMGRDKRAKERKTRRDEKRDKRQKRTMRQE